jgi:hypothetical protein
MTSVIKLQAPFERLKIYNNNADIALRKAIILQAIIDASNAGNNAAAKKIELEAKEWIFGNSDYFKTMCYEANLHPEYVIKLTNDMIEIQKIKYKKKQALKAKLQESYFKDHAIIFYTSYTTKKAS